MCRYTNRVWDHARPRATFPLVSTLDLRQLRSVVEVAQQRSFTRAAQRMHVAQQALSQQVRNVEDQVGVQLFLRTARGVEPTAAGEVFVEEARRVLTGVDRLVQRTRAAAEGLSGTLRVAYSLATVYETLPRLLEALRDATPDVRVEEREMVASEMEQALLDGRADVALCPRAVVGAGIDRVEVRREELVFAVGADHPWATREVVPLAELADERLVVWGRDTAPGYHDAVLASCRQAGFEPHVGEPSSGATVWGAIANGAGVGLVVTSIAVGLPRGLALVRIEPPVPRLTIDLLWAHEDATPLVARVRTIAEQLAHRW